MIPALLLECTVYGGLSEKHMGPLYSLAQMNIMKDVDIYMYVNVFVLCIYK